MYKLINAFSGGSLIGILGGLVGLGGAEFRLPMLISIFNFTALSAIIINKLISLIVVSSSLIFRIDTSSFPLLYQHVYIMLFLLSGSIIGAWFGANIALTIDNKLLHKIIAFLLLFIAIVIILEHFILHDNYMPMFNNNIVNYIIGIFTGAIIGIIASILGVAGGELYIPAIILIYGIDIKLAGSLSLAISLPTMLVAFFRYKKSEHFKIVYINKIFILIMAIGSILGAYLGSIFLGIISTNILIPLLSIILFVSSYKMYKVKENK